MKRAFAPILVLAMALATPSALRAAVAQDSSSAVTGDWNMTLETPQGTMDMGMSLEVKQGKLTGTLHGTQGDVPLAGTVDGKTLRMELNADTPQGSMTIDFTGEIDGDKITNGSADLGGMGTMTWSATRAPKM
jgi:hypothetical protein